MLLNKQLCAKLYGKVPLPRVTLFQVGHISLHLRIAPDAVAEDLQLFGGSNSSQCRLAQLVPSWSSLRGDIKRTFLHFPTCCPKNFKMNPQNL